MTEEKTKQKIKKLLNLLTRVEIKIKQLQESHKSIIKDIELLKKELELEKLYD